MAQYCHSFHIVAQRNSEFTGYAVDLWNYIRIQHGIVELTEELWN